MISVRFLVKQILRHALSGEFDSEKVFSTNTNLILINFFSNNQILCLALETLDGLSDIKVQLLIQFQCIYCMQLNF